MQIDEDDYIGRNVDEVAAELRAMGLEVDTQPIDNPGDEETDTVASVSPTSGLFEGDTVTVEYYREAEPTSEPPTTEPTLGAAAHHSDHPDQPDLADYDRIRRPGHRDPVDVRHPAAPASRSAGAGAS